MRYFIGSVLSPYEKEKNAENDPTFAFSKEEADNLKLDGIPVRMEHHKDMKVGSIVKSWSSDDGSKWVMGKLDGEGFQSKFAQHAVDKNPDTGGAYYQGLSLQHVHRQFASGTKSASTKEAIEVSLVCEPRRSDCKIAYVDSEDTPNSAQIKNMQYILNERSNKMTEPVEQPAPTPEPVEAPAGNMSKEQMMKIIIEQQKSLEESKTSQNTELEELRRLKVEIERQKEEELKKQSEKSHAMAKTLVDNWSESLDQESMTEAQKTSILDASRSHPQEMIELLRVAHCASKKHREAEARFTEYKALMEKTQLSKQFDAVMSKKPAAPAPVVHAASKKRKTMSDPEAFLKALSQYNSSGSARDHMEQVSQIGVRKPYKRQTFY